MRPLHQLPVIQHMMHILQILFNSHQIIGGDFTPLLLPQILYNLSEFVGFLGAQMSQTDKTISEKGKVIE